MKIAGIVIGAILLLVLIMGGWLWSGRGGLIDRSQGVDEKLAQVKTSISVGLILFRIWSPAWITSCSASRRP